MGTSSSKNSDCSHGGERHLEGGRQLYVSLRMEDFKIKNDLTPHVYGSSPIIGSWDSSKSLPMGKDSPSTWELSFVVPSNHETLDFKFLLKPSCSDAPCVVEEGPKRLLTRGKLEWDAWAAIFWPDGDEEMVVECRVSIKADIVSPFDLAASWRAYRDNIQPSTAAGIPDISINAGLDAGCEDIEVIVPDASKVLPVSGMVESKSVGTFSPLQKQDGQWGLFVDRGVGSPRLVKSASAGAFTNDLKSESEAKKAMPAAAGAVAAAAVADQLLGQKEDSLLAIVLVGLPARGKTFTAVKLTRYLRWLGHETRHFNVGKYRRLKHGTNQSADFFRADNPEGMEARNEVAALAMEDMISWMQEGGQVGIFDATNSTRKRRNMLMKMAEGKCKIIFLETLCNDERIIERNIRLKIQQSPDYAEQPDFKVGLQDFKTRLANYEKAYEPVKEGSYIKMIDMVSGHGGQIQVNNISGYLPGRIVFFLDLATGMKIGLGHERGGMYYLDGSTPGTDHVAEQPDSTLLWHWRLGHHFLYKLRLVVYVQFSASLGC